MIDDLDRIMAVMDSAFDPHWGEAWNRAQVISSLALPTTHYRLVNAEGERPSEGQTAAGFILVKAAPGEEELLLIGVDPAHRGKGLGKKLMGLFIRDATSRSAESIFLEMRHNNPAVHLYEFYKFKPIGKRKDYYTLGDGSKLDAVTYGLQIK